VIVAWHKQPGDAIVRDEALVDIETDKVVLEVPAPNDGVLDSILINSGDTVIADQVIGVINDGAMATAMQAGSAAVAEDTPADRLAGIGPAARKLLADYDLDPERIKGTGRDGRITKADVLTFLRSRPAEPAVTGTRPAVTPSNTPGLPDVDEDRPQKRVPMSRLRARIAERMLHVNMQPVMELRSRHKEAFERQHGVRLGFMSFFVRAAAEALKRHPDINASIDGDEIVYHGFCDIGVAIGTERGLVVPILRNAEYMSLAEIETYILGFANNKARDGKLEMEDITGGTFTISNGGVFGSMLSTPILNPPQSAILGMHKIQDRPVAENGQVVIRPIMYVALTYDHRIVDGKSAVTFLRAIRELLEEPASMLLEI
jgi:2-oxoglutarate dehydrogenase E2 component (dihydrolipoamide succinyltransferase)